MIHMVLPNNLIERVFIVNLFTAFCLLWLVSMAWSMPVTISRGQPLPDATLIGMNASPIQLSAFKGRVKILSMVPQLNTPVCDEQTHQFSEHTEGLDHVIEIVTISTNTYDDQVAFAKKANIANITFLSDSPHFDFGNKTGLLYPRRHILQRAVMVVDQENIIRYIEIVPMGQLPNFTAALDATRRVLGQPS